MPNDESAIQAADDSVDALPFSTDSNTESDETQNSGDNIITISTTTIISRPLSVEESGDTNLSERTIKEHNITTSERIVQFLSKKPVAPAATTSQTPNRPNEEAPRKSNFSRCISFQDNIADVHHRKGRRLHGLQLPLHPLQIFGWLVLILFGLASYYLLIPSFTSDIQGPLYGLITGLYIVHVVSHVTALLTDPADRELRRVHRNDRIVPEFDRSKHTHVIENGRCHLCNIRTSSQRTKHCSVCNKCVGKFDHHCKWLNHCIGSRNYVAFLMCVVSAVIATLVIVAAVIARIALYYMQPEWFSLWHPAVTGDNVSSEESVAFVVANDSLATTATDLEFISLAAPNNSLNLMNATLTDESELFGNVSSVTPSLIDNVTALITEAVNETMLLVNLTTNDLVTAPPLEPSAAATTVVAANSTTIGGIGINDTIFLVLIGFLGLLAAITAGLLLHLCFFHIYISFLGLTTYEYIRNHRQAQEAKTKSLLATAALPSDGQPHRSSSRLHPSGKSVDCGQIYFCSRLRNPNANDLRYCEARKSDEERQKDDGGGLAAALHCCANSREYHQTALKTYYMCSLLEEGAATATNGLPTAISHISGNSDGPNPSVEAFYGNYDPEAADTDTSDTVRTFHCCSTFAATTTQRRVSAATTKATLVTDLESAAATLSGRRSYLKYTEQCTFCTFRIRRSPIVAKRSASAGTNATMRSSATRTLHTEVSQSSSSATSRNAPGGGLGGGIENQRCCMKAISKHQRWRRKWNCCANVPDSPDVPTDIIASLAMSHGPQSAAGVAAKNLNATEIPVHFIKTINNGLTTTTTTSSSVTSSPSLQCQSRPTSPRGSHLKAQGRVRNGHNWPLARFRHMLRMLSRHRRTRCQHQCDEQHGESVAAGGVVGGDQVKQNQVRPLQFQNDNNGLCFHHQLQQQRLQAAQQHPQGQNYYDSSSPQPPSSTTTERSSDPEMFSDSSNLPTPNNAVEHMLPTTVIRDDTSMTYTSLPPILTLPPALPPPTRRKIPNPTDLEELAETLSFASNPSSGFIAGSGGQRLPALNNIYRRQRRKHFLRTRSPTLSPIHESGLSNPTSPQPGRHNTTSSPVSCSPSTGLIVNNLCVPNSEQARKMGSNTSLHSVSSNSSSN